MDRSLDDQRRHELNRRDLLGRAAALVAGAGAVAAPATSATGDSLPPIAHDHDLERALPALSNWGR
jgi:hypothetical protein